MRGASPRPIDDPIYFDDNGEYAWVRISDVTASDGLLTSTTQRLSTLGSSKSVKLDRGKLFLSIAGSVGKPCINDIKACIHDGFVYFPYLPLESQKFLYWIFEARECFSGLGKLGTQLNLNTETVGNIAIPFPDLATQRQIADFLDRETARIDLLIEKKQRLVEVLEEKRAAKQQSTIDDLLNFFGASRLKNFTLSITTGPFGSAIKQDEYVEGGIPILNPAHIGKGRITPDASVTLSDEKFRELQYWRLKPGDVLMGRRGDLGRCAVVDDELGDSICGTGCLRLRVHPRHNPSYIYLIVSSRRSREWLDLNAVGTTMKNLNEAIVGRLPVPAVRREEQDKFVSDIQNAHQRNAKVSANIMASIDRLKEYRSALITAAVTGQIDVATYGKAGTTSATLDRIEEEMSS
ncbi:hypothetical protein CKO19_01245 [Rhodovulum adriaticum]|nr:hypothetical protein [Rhodovulum adriaticum]